MGVSAGVVRASMVLSLVSDLLEKARTVNRLVAAEAPDSELAAPSPDACSHCPYRSRCSPYFDALDDSWERFRVDLLRLVTDVEVHHDTASIRIQVESTNLADGRPDITVVGIPAELKPPPGATVAVVDALPSSALGHLRAAWDSQLTILSSRG